MLGRAALQLEDATTEWFYARKRMCDWPTIAKTRQRLEPREESRRSRCWRWILPPPYSWIARGGPRLRWPFPNL